MLTLHMVSLDEGLAMPAVQAAIANFNCGHEPWARALSVYLHRYADRDQQALETSTYLGLDDQGNLLGYVNLSWLRVKRAGPAAERPLIVGLPGGYVDLPALWIGRFAVSQHLQRQGVGQALMDWVEDVAFSSKVAVRFIALHADENNERAIGFYKGRQFFEADRDETKHQITMLRDLIEDS